MVLQLDGTVYVTTIAIMAFMTALTLFLTTFVQLKRRKRSVGAYVAIFVLLTIYIQIYETLMYYWGGKIWFPAGLVEIFVFAILIVVMTEGCFWRNYCILVLTQSVTSLVWQVILLPFPKAWKVVRNTVTMQAMPVSRIALFAYGILFVSYVITVIVLKKIFRQEYSGNGVIYKRIMIIYIAISYVSLSSRFKLIDQIRQGKGVGSFVALYLVWIVGMVILCNFVPYAYNKSDAKWHKKEQQMLAQMLAESERHYERLVEEPFVYGQTLSGNVTLDAVVADYTKRAQERTLLFDAVVEPVHISGMAELDVTVIVDAMLEIAFAQVSTDADAFVQLTVRQRKGSLFLNVDYAAGKRMLHKKEQALADALIRKYDGSKQLRKNGRERQICVLLPNQAEK